MSSSYRIIIPARYASSRLPGKPLRLLAGKPMLQWAWENARRAGATDVVVATDDGRIREVAVGFGADVCMTDAGHASGTDRLAEVCRVRGWSPDAIVVNLQGDEPGVEADLLDQVADNLAATSEASMATFATPIRDAASLFDENVVKVVCDQRGLALYFSRAPIPWMRGVFGSGAGQAQPALDGASGGPGFLRHIGLYAYRVSTLLRLADTPGAAIEQAEALEQLRALHLGLRIHVGVIPEPPAHGVDTEADVARVEAMLLRRGS